MPTLKMIGAAEKNAKALNIKIPCIVLIDYDACWRFNEYCWLLQPPRYKDVRWEFEFCYFAGIPVALKDFKSKLGFLFWFSVHFRIFVVSEVKPKKLIDLTCYPFFTYSRRKKLVIWCLRQVLKD